MQIEMTASDGTIWRVNRDQEQVIIHDAQGKQRLVFREGGMVAIHAIESLAKQDREKAARAK